MNLPMRSDRSRYWQVYVTCCCVTLASTALQWVEPGLGDAASAYQLVMLLVTVFGLMPVFKDSAAALTRPQAVAVVFVSAVINIVCFSFLHLRAGLHDSTGASDATSIVDGLYFSVVTFTTLGYGDIQPSPDGRLLAACQALYGYLYLGLAVGLAANGFKPSTRQDRAR